MTSPDRTPGEPILYNRFTHGYVDTITHYTPFYVCIGCNCTCALKEESPLKRKIYNIQMANSHNTMLYYGRSLPKGYSRSIH
uniref:Uncharacterized protein n=1 Tax=Timema bartmani TaxID=61472 RepID=A0A7R9F5M0_9NEOP|nr:unnamed protein product [Timema bartmani]